MKIINIYYFFYVLCCFFFFLFSHADTCNSQHCNTNGTIKLNLRRERVSKTKALLVRTQVNRIFTDRKLHGKFLEY